MCRCSATLGFGVGCRRQLALIGKHLDVIRRHTQGRIPRMASEDTSASAPVARRIRQVRSELGLNQTEFARALGVSRSHISEVEHDTVKIPVDLLFSIEKVFRNQTSKASVLWMISGDTRPVPWGDNPASSSLNQILSLDRRALICGVKVLHQLDFPKLTNEIAAEFLLRTIYIYLSEMERHKQSGLDADEARALAERACLRSSEDLGGWAAEGAPDAPLNTKARAAGS